MRTVPFREVLHGVAYKMGLDPDQSNFLTNQAIPIGTYIDEWVRRTYDARDWPEWVVTHKFTPSSHVVTWDARSGDFVSAQEPLGKLLQLGRIYKVFLVDPSTTSAPVDTPFTLRDNGIHCGFEHGTSVWIRFMVPPPRYTAVQWAGDTTFQKDDVTYSYTTGQVYKSKSNGNIGHNPATTFSVPPVPHVIEPHPPSPVLDTETTQEFAAGRISVTAQDQIVDITFQSEETVLPDPPLASTQFYIEVFDSAGAVLGGFTVASGSDSIADMLDDLVTQITGDPGFASFTVTADHPTFTIRLEDASDFRINQAYWSRGAGENHVQVIQIQPFIDTIAAAALTPQISTLTITEADVVPGATYDVTFTDVEGAEHAVSYTAETYDGVEQIFGGLFSAISAAQATDEFFATVASTFDATSLSAAFTVPAPFSLDAQALPPGSSWWELVPFPAALADQVMTGALGDLLFEWGQSEKAGAEDQKVPLEAQVSESKFTTVPTPMLTGQEAPLSRYKVQ